MNMKKVYRQELKMLARAERKLNRDYYRFCNAEGRKIAAIKRNINRGFKATEREIVRIQTRIDILNGRLSSQ